MEEEKKGYLILTRNKDESIIIGDEIEILMMGINGTNVGQARLGIKASKQIQVHRKEIWERIKRQENAGAHNCVEYADYKIGKSGMRIAQCDMCGRRWGIPDNE